MLPLRLEQFWAVSAGGARSGIALGSRGTLVTGPSKSELYIKFNSRPPMALAITAGTNHTPSCFTVLAGRNVKYLKSSHHPRFSRISQ